MVLLRLPNRLDTAIAIGCSRGLLSLGALDNCALRWEYLWHSSSFFSWDLRGTGWLGEFGLILDLCLPRISRISLVSRAKTSSTLMSLVTEMAGGMLPLPITFLNVANESYRTVEFETYDDLKRACAHLHDTEYRGFRVSCIAEVNNFLPYVFEVASNISFQDLSASGRFNGGSSGYPPRGRSRSPPPPGAYGSRRGYSPPPPPRGRYSPPPPRGYGGSSRRYDSPQPRSYRERSPPRGPPRDPYYNGGAERGRTPPPIRRPPPPADDYPPPPPRSSGAYDAPRDYPPRRGYEDPVYPPPEHSRSRYDDRRYPSPGPPRGRTPPPVRGPPPPAGRYDDYDRRRY